MQKLIAVLLAIVFVACGGGPTGTEASGEIVNLVLDADSITFVEAGVDLTESLYGITSEGDTVYNPDGVTFELPDGFTRDGSVLRATREASGVVVANLNPSDSVLMRAAHHLDSLAPWSFRRTCYYGTNRYNRDDDGQTYTVDSLISTSTVDSIEYVEDPVYVPLRGYGTGTSIWYWEDGQVDTATYAGDTPVFSAEQSGVDTLTTSRVPVPAVQNSPRRYVRQDSVCGAYDSTGIYLLEQQ